MALPHDTTKRLVMGGSPQGENMSRLVAIFLHLARGHRDDLFSFSKAHSRQHRPPRSDERLGAARDHAAIQPRFDVTHAADAGHRRQRRPLGSDAPQGYSFHLNQ